MKTAAYILLLLIMPLCSVAQNDPIIKHSLTTKDEVQIEKTSNTKKDKSLNSETKSQLLKLNYKKSIDLTSIKAFRKSLQIKTKAIKSC